MDHEEEKSTATTTTVGSKYGMFILYGLPFVTLIGFSGSQCRSHGIPALATTLTTMHFLKRLLEVQFVHQYSGQMSFPMSILIGMCYSLSSALIATVSVQTPTPSCGLVGTILFVIGNIGNLYHHWLLRTLRKDNSTNKNNDVTGPSSTSSPYLMPRGGLFHYVAAPHYLFELCTWLGIAITSQHANVYLVAAGMTSYLAGRSVAQNRYNTLNFPEWSTSKRKNNMIPFVF